MGRVLVACEYSGIVRDAFIRRGHDAISCDILPTESPGPHIQGDVIPEILKPWDLVIAHPPCTYLANSGVRWLHTQNGRWEKMVSGAGFFGAMKMAGADKIAIENPIPHKYAREYIGKYDQIIQPWQFGHGETKAICLWLYGLPKLEPTDVVEGREARVHRLPPSKDRGKLRSRFFEGIADAMAVQWGGLL